MIHFIDRSDAHLDLDTSRSFTALRYGILIKRFGRKIAEADAGFEQDQFDTDDAVYVIVRNS